MRLSSLQHVTFAIADAMLAGPPEPDALVARMTAALGVRADWMTGIARTTSRRFAARWEHVKRDELLRMIAATESFQLAWHNEHQRPVVVRVLKRAPQQVAPPPRLAHVALPQLPTLGDLAAWLEVDDADLGWFADQWRVMPQASSTPLHHYSYKAIEKRDGRCRLIEMPKSRLRDLQRKILKGLLEHVPPHECAHGFRKGRNTASYATPHLGKDVVVRFDLADFFASVHAGRVHALMRTLGYPLEVARALTAICTNRVPSARLLADDVRERFDWQEKQRYRTRHLPQGAPTSPALANLCAYRLDLRLAGLARTMCTSYTRYADDLAFSGGRELARGVERLAVRVAAIAMEEGFSIQLRKTRVMRRAARQRLAGVVVNQRPNLARDEFDALKATLTNCVRYGVEGQNRDGHRDFRAHLEGKVAQVCFLNPGRGEKLRGILRQIQWDVSGAHE
ncbi:RNA-directed DNA polymerase [Paraburkholderia sp. DHOC27]|nr:RNA-directed DNA polymerase [Paraburkholderia sp. DHOC27]